MQVGVLVTWRELTGTEPTMTMLEERLAPFRLSAVLLGLARIAALLKTWQNAPDSTTDRLLVQRLLPTYYPRIRAICQYNAHRICLPR